MKNGNQQFPPNIFYQGLKFDPANPTTPFPVNLAVQLPKSYVYCRKINTNGASSTWLNNIYLHFAPFYDALPLNAATGRQIQLGAMPGVFPLGQAGTAAPSFQKLRFKCGCPQNLFISCDYQGGGAYTDVIAFWDDDFDYDIPSHNT